MQDKVKKALLKKALGYYTNEVVFEYSLDEGEEKLLKKKVIKKYIAPDNGALRILLELEGCIDEVSGMTDEQLSCEKDRLIALLKEEQIED